MSNSKSYFLKTALIARGLAELSVLAILSMLPVGLLVSKHFFALHLILKIALCCLSPISLLGIWGLIQIPFRVSVDDFGISVRSLARKNFLAWEEILSLKQASPYGLKQYVLTGKSSSLSFPRMLNNVSDLVSSIKARIPALSSATISDGKIFCLPRVSFLLDCFKWLLQLAFAGFFAQFACTLAISEKNSQGDLFIIYLAAASIFIGVLWNLAQLLRQPHRILIEKDGLVLSSMFSKAKIAWTELRSLKQAGVFHAEGLALGSTKGSYVLSADINEIDELAELISAKMKLEPRGPN